MKTIYCLKLKADDNLLHTMSKHSVYLQKYASFICSAAAKLNSGHGVSELAYQTCTDHDETQHRFTRDQYLVLMEAGILIFYSGKKLFKFSLKKSNFLQKINLFFTKTKN